MNRFWKVARFVVFMGDVGEFHHYHWVAVFTTFIVGAVLKSNMPDATLLPVAGGLIAGLAAGWMVRRVELRRRSDA